MPLAKRWRWRRGSSRKLTQNPAVTYLHADPSFPDCLPGKTVHAKGIIAFHEGKGIRQQIAKLKALYLNRQ